MEIIFQILLLAAVSFNVTMLLSISQKLNKFLRDAQLSREHVLQKMHMQTEMSENSFDEVMAQAALHSDSTSRALQVILERLDAAKPIKPNNWGSVKKAFSGPVRVEINE